MHDQTIHFINSDVTVALDRQGGTTTVRDGSGDPVIIIDADWDAFDESTRWTGAPRYQAAFKAISAGCDCAADNDAVEYFTIVRNRVIEIARRRSQERRRSIASRVITVEPSAVERFKSTWPCHGIDQVDHLMILERDGELIDVEAYDDNCDPIECDGDAVAALVDDAIRGASISRVRIPGQDPFWEFA